MTQARRHSRSFAGGEITPELYGRIDLAKFQIGLKRCENAQVLPHGPVTRRPGTEYVLQAKSSGTVRLIPFSFNTEQTYVIEMGYQYMRFHSNGGTVLSIPQALTSITSAAIGVATYTGTDPADGDWVYLSGVAGMVEVNGRYVVVNGVDPVAKSFEIYDLSGSPIDTSGYAAGTGGTMAPVYEVATPYLEADLFDINYAQNADVLTLVHPSYAPRALSRLTSTTFSLATIAFEPSISEPLSVGVTKSGGTSAIHEYSYVVTAIDEDGFEESIASTSASVKDDLSAAGRYHTVTWLAPTTGTPVRYNIYRATDLSSAGNFGLYGYIGQSDTLFFEDANIAADFSVTPPIVDNPFDATDNYPGAVSYFEQRKIYGNTNNKPQNYWLTRPATETNLYRSLPVQDNDAIRGRLVAQQVNEIRHFIPLSELLVLTVGGEWILSGGDGSGVTPTGISVRPQSYEGSSKVVPQVTGSSVLFVQENKSRVFEISYSWESSAYRADDASLMAPHLVDEYQVQQIAFSRSPDAVLWAIRDDGVLLGLTYVPKQEVRGWHQHTTDGLFKSVATVHEGSRDVPYFVVERTINGATRKFVERLHDREFSVLEDWFGVDAGLTYSGAATTVISGLWHLEGETVQVLGDGARVPDVTVQNGSVTLPAAVSKAHIGLGYAPIIEFLPESFNAPAGGQGLAKSSTSALLRLYKSVAVKIGQTVATARMYPGRTTEGYGNPPAMISEEIDVTLDTSYTQDGELLVTQEGPEPLTLVALVTEMDVGE